MANERHIERNDRGQHINWPFVLVAVLFLIVTAAFIYYYFQTLDNFTQKDAAITSLQGQVVNLNSQVTSRQNDLSAANAKIAPLQSQFALTQTQLVDANAYIDTVKAQIANATAQVATFKSQNADLQKIVSMSESKVITEQVTVHQGMGQISSLISFKADYAGYIIVTATVSSTTGFIQVTCDNANYPFNTNKYYTADQSIFSIPVLPGTIGVFAGNTDKLYEPNATVSVTYYY